MGSKLSLLSAVIGGAIFIYIGIATSASASALDMINSLIIQYSPGYSSTIIPIIKWVTGIGGFGVVLGGLVAYFGSGQFKQFGGYMIILSALGGILSYAAILYDAQQSGLFSQSWNVIQNFLITSGPGLLASLLSVLAFLKSGE